MIYYGTSAKLVLCEYLLIWARIVDGMWKIPTAAAADDGDEYRTRQTAVGLIIHSWKVIQIYVYYSVMRLGISHFPRSFTNALHVTFSFKPTIPTPANRNIRAEKPRKIISAALIKHYFCFALHKQAE